MATSDERCRACRHFDHRYTGRGGRRAGMCRAWGFSVNEDDCRGCARREPAGEEAVTDGEQRARGADHERA